MFLSEYDFKLYEGFFMENIAPNLPDFEGIFFQIARL
jgi:hypothetical protein